MLDVQQNVSLQAFNSLAINSMARYFMAIEQAEQIPEALNFAGQKQLAVYVLAGGSNVVLPDYIDGLVLYMACKGWQATNTIDNADQVMVTAAAGENWHTLVTQCLQKGYYGLENLALIPGSVGAAPIQNIGAYGVELVDVFDSLYGWNRKAQCWQSLSKADCQFAYRDSVFKQDLKDRFIISSVTLKLHRNKAPHSGYAALNQTLAAQGISNPTPEQVAEAVIAIRQSKLPDPQTLPNAGSFFKNPLVSAAEIEKLLSKYPDLIHYPQADGRYKLAAGWLLEQAGWKGRRSGNIGMHDQQSLVLVNYGGASLSEVLDFAGLIQQDIQHTFSVSLDIEPAIIK